MLINVRFFIIRHWDDPDEFWGHYYEKEVEEAEFLESKGIIKYERHTIRENGSSQICLTKDELGDR